MGSEARTRLALAALLVVTLFSFGQVFARGEYPGPALLGMLTAGVIAAGTRRAGLSTWLTFVVSGAGLIGYVALVFQGRHTFYGLPTVDALRRVVLSLDRAYDASLIDYAPVPVRPGYVVGMVVAMWGATTIGEIATFRWRRPLLAAVPTIGLFGFLSIVGTRTGTTLLVLTYIAALLTFLAAESSHRLRAWGRWVTGIGGEGPGEAAAVSGQLARRMGASCLAAALIAPAFLPALGDGLLSWRSGQGIGGSGLGAGAASGEIDLLASLKPTLIERSGEELFRMHSDRPSYWRLASLARFDGTSWRPAADTTRTRASTGVIAAEGRVTEAKNLEQRITVSGLKGEAMPAAVQAAFVDVNEDVGGRSDTDVYFDFNSGALTMQGGVVEGLSFTVISQQPDLTFGDLATARVATADPEYTSAPDLSPQVVALRDRWVAGAATPIDRLLRLQRHLRADFDYSLDVEARASTDYLTQFLTETKVGYCQQFAASFALLARSLGFPTRVSIGFLPGETNISRPQDYIVRGTHAHSWPEVLFEEYGWVAFEPTPGNNAAPPRYTVPPSRAAAAPDPFAPGAVAGGNPLNLDGNQNVPTGGRDRGGEIPGTARDPRSNIYEWQKTFSDLLAVLLIVLLISICSVPLVKTTRLALLYRGARTPGAEAAAAFRVFELEAAELASARAPSESASHFARRLGAGHSVPKKPAARLAAIYELATYGPRPLEAALAEEARTNARSLRRALWSGAGWWRRLQRLFSPAGLLTPP